MRQSIKLAKVKETPIRRKKPKDAAMKKSNLVRSVVAMTATIQKASTTTLL